MHEENSAPQSTAHAEALGYEDSDVAIPVLMKWGLFLVVFVGITSVIVLGIYAFLVPQFTKVVLGHGVDASANLQRPELGPEVPKLQPDPVLDIKKYRRAENAHVTGYGVWKDGDGKDVTYIPISRAMEIVEAKGLPVATADRATNDVTPPAVDRGFVDNPLPDGTQPGVPGKVGPENGNSLDDPAYLHHPPGM